MKLNEFTNASVKNREELEAMITKEGIYIPDSLIRVAPSEKDRDEDGTIRNQVLRYYNSNPDLMLLALMNFDKVLEENQKARISTADFAKQLADDKKSLTNTDGDDTVTVLENYLFKVWPIMDRVATIARKERTKPRRMIDVALDKLNIIVVMEYLIAWNNAKKDIPEMKYSRYQDYMIN